MYIPYSFFEQLRDKVTVSDVVRQKINLTRKGQEYLGLCPFHNEKTPSFTVNDHKKFYHCFGCGAHGDVIGFVSETSGMSRHDAARKIAEDNGIAVPQPTAEQARQYEESEQIYKILSLAGHFFKESLSKDAKVYLEKRKISKQEISDYDIGYAPSGDVLQNYLESKKVTLRNIYDAGLVAKNEEGDVYPVFRNRIIFPIKNVYGKVIAFGGRIIGEGQPKYLNSPETLVFKKSETLYGEDKATGAAYQKNRIIVVEGYLDVIAMHTSGFSETVATLGTAVTSQHLLKLWKIADEVIFCMDGDSAGLRSMQRVINVLLPLMKDQNKASFVLLPGSLDPDDFVRKYGKQKMEELFTARLPVSEMIWYLETNGKVITSPEDKASLESRLKEYTNNAANQSLARYMNSDFRNKIWSIGKKNIIKPKSNLKTLGSHTSLEVVYYNLMSLVIKNPRLLGVSNIYESFIYMDFSSGQFDELRNKILELYAEGEEKFIERLRELSQTSGFSSIFVILCESDAAFIDSASLSNSELDIMTLWELWFKKYEYEKLKEEYSHILGDMTEKSFEQSMEYMNEMRKIEESIKELTEKLQ